MNLHETGILVRTVRACCPAQAIDTFTPEAWQPVLSDITLPEAMAAVRAIARRPDPKPLWIDPRQILNEARRGRHQQQDRYRAIAPPADKPSIDTVRHHVATIKAACHRGDQNHD